MIGHQQKNSTITPCLTLVRPERNAIPLLIDSPHSGTVFPEDFVFCCSAAELRRSEDSYVDQFMATATHYGATTLKAMVSRAYIDLNRSLGDIPASLCSDPIPWPTHRSKRVLYGMGLIRHLVRPNEPVYASPLPFTAIKKRIDDYYAPYYATLGAEIAALKNAHGRVLHLDLHAMPQLGFDGARQPDIVIGDHDGHSSARVYRDMLRRFFESHGLKVMINNPYKGVELTRAFAKPRQGIHAIQIEINKGLYMDENTMATHAGMVEMMGLFEDLWRYLAQIFEANAATKAAE